MKTASNKVKFSITEVNDFSDLMLVQTSINTMYSTGQPALDHKKFTDQSLYNF